MRTASLIVTTAALAALTQPAAGAGLGAPADVGPRGGHWTGCYVGGFGGGLWGDSEKWIVRTPGGDHGGQSLGGHDLDSVTGGVQAGCDYQTAGGFVLGVQGDYGWAQAKGTHASAREFGVFYHSEVEGLGAVTGRLGYGWDRVLAYVRGGAAWERVDYAASTIITGLAYRASDTRSGWTIGGGGEYAITDHLSAFVDYGYYDFGTERIALTPQIPGLPVGFLDIEDSASVVRAGVNLRFSR